VDIVEAFTAMRHEWRGQTKETRALAEQIEAAVETLRSLEASRQVEAAPRRQEESGEARRLAQLVCETDHQLARAVAAIAQWEANQAQRAAADAKAAERFYQQMGRLARWFARPLLDQIAERRAAREQIHEHPAVEGLNLVLARLRRAMKELRLERIEVEGLAFDANLMNAIGTVAAADCPSGHVAEQISPCYRWQGQILSFADVRVAK
jgi:molecular chaperone GrpE